MALKRPSHSDANAPGRFPGAFRSWDLRHPGAAGRALATTPPPNARRVAPIELYVAFVALAGAGLTAWLVLSDRFHLDVLAPGVFWPGGARRLMFMAFVLLAELLPITVPRGNDTEEITTSSTFAFGLVLGW